MGYNFNPSNPQHRREVDADVTAIDATDCEGCGDRVHMDLVADTLEWNSNPPEALCPDCREERRP